MRKSLIIAAALVSASVATTAQATINLVTNGSFENGVALPMGETFLSTGNTTSITGWRVLSAGVHYVNNSVWDAAAGSRSVELSSVSGANGGISQRINGFVTGQRYRLTYRVSSDPANTALSPYGVGYTVSVTGGAAVNPVYTYMPGFNSASNMMYQTATYDFIASNALQTLQFRARGRTNGFGPVIDNVNISVIPEASTWAMLVAGFGLVGVASRRRKRVSVTA